MIYQWNPADYSAHSTAQLIWAKELLTQLKLKEGEWVLDLGCGHGQVTALMAEQVPQGQVHGIDNAFNMISLARERFSPNQYPNLSFLVMDATRLAFRSTFNVVFSNAVLHWVEDHLAVLGGVWRALRPGGRALLQMGGSGNAAGVLTVLEKLTDRQPWRAYFQDFRFPYHFYGPDDYERWLAQVGLTPQYIKLIDKDMIHNGREGLAGWLRTTWHPFLAQIPSSDQNQFLNEWIDDYVNLYPVDEKGDIHVAMVRLEVSSRKPAGDDSLPLKVASKIK